MTDESPGGDARGGGGEDGVAVLVVPGQPHLARVLELELTGMIPVGELRLLARLQLDYVLQPVPVEQAAPGGFREYATPYRTSSRVDGAPTWGRAPWHYGWKSEPHFHPITVP